MATGNHKVQIIVGVNDLASAPLRNIQRQVAGMSRGITGTGSAFGALSRGLDTSIRSLDRMATSMYRFNMYTSNLQRNLRNIGALSAIAIGGLAVNSANKAMDFSMETAKMQTRMEVGPGVRKEIEDYILNELNRQVMFTPTQIAEMATTLGQSGVDNTKDMKAMLKTSTYFAEATDSSPTDAAEMIIAAAKGFKISMENSSSITDKLTVAVNKSLLRVEEMPHALGQLSGRANMFGQSLDSSLVALMTIRDQGMGAAQGAQNLLHGLRQASMVGNEMALLPRRKRFYQELGMDDSFFDMEKRQMKEYHEVIASLEKTMINKGYINPKYRKGIKSFDDYQNFLQEQGGAAPDDFWDAKEAMPLITRVFGASGMTPFMMGLQSQYEAVDPETGKKTGEVLYGSAAAKRRYEEVKNSDGAVDIAHGIIEQEARFQLGVLKGAFEATQIKFMDNMLPGIKGASQLLTEWLMGDRAMQPIHEPSRGNYRVDDAGPLTKLQRFEGVYNEVADNFRKAGNDMTADIIRGIGDGLVAGIQIGGAMGPLRDQIGEAFGNLFTADWGDSVWTLPWHVIDNGAKFIEDVGKANDKLSEAISNLPEDLQDPANLISQLAKGGFIMLATGAIVGVVRLAIQGLSAALKGAKLAGQLTAAIVKWVIGDVNGAEKTGLPDITKTINANIVNVYGGTVNGMGGPGGAGSGKNPKPGIPPVIVDSKGRPLPPSTPTPKPIPRPPLTIGGAARYLATAIPMLVRGALRIAGTYGLAAYTGYEIGKVLGRKLNEFMDKDAAGEIEWTKKFRTWLPIYGADDKIEAEKERRERAKELYLSNTELKAAPDRNLNKNNAYNVFDHMPTERANGTLDFYSSQMGRMGNEIHIEPKIEVKPEIKTQAPIFEPIFTPTFNPILQLPKQPPISEERKKLISMLPKEEGEMLRKATIENLNGVNNAITNGFKNANDKLQNVRVDNMLNLQFNPNINISGNIREYFNPIVSMTNNRATFNQPSARSNAGSRGVEISSRRNGPQLLQ